MSCRVWVYIALLICTPLNWCIFYPVIEIIKNKKWEPLHAAPKCSPVQSTRCLFKNLARKWQSPTERLSPTDRLSPTETVTETVTNIDTVMHTVTNRDCPQLRLSQRLSPTGKLSPTETVTNRDCHRDCHQQRYCHRDCHQRDSQTGRVHRYGINNQWLGYDGRMDESGL